MLKSKQAGGRRGRRRRRKNLVKSLKPCLIYYIILISVKWLAALCEFLNFIFSKLKNATTIVEESHLAVKKTSNER